MSRGNITALVTGLYKEEFSAFQKLLNISEMLAERAEPRAAIVKGRPLTLAVLTLWTKARKTARAINLLALGGYGEDAMILSRSLMNLCFDLGYICYEKCDERASRWLANGQLAQRRWLQWAGESPPNEDTINGRNVKELASEWEKVKIRDRAVVSDRLNLYDTFYRLGSTFEHSDAWSGLFFTAFDGERATFHPEPGPSMIGMALFVGALALVDILSTAALFYSVDLGVAQKEMEDIVETWLRRITAIGKQA